MIEFLHGRLAENQSTHLVINVGGVGFGLEVSTRTSEKFTHQVGETVQVLTYLHVREEALDLYGFLDLAEKSLFLKLIGVSGIGPKLALRILSSVTPTQLADLIRHGDAQGLTALKGVGKKTAEVLIASLRASVTKMDLPVEAGLEAGTPVTGGFQRDAIRALVSLGVKEIQAQEAVQKAARKLGKDTDASRLIAQALQEV